MGGAGPAACLAAAPAGAAAQLLPEALPTAHLRRLDER